MAQPSRRTFLRTAGIGAAAVGAAAALPGPVAAAAVRPHPAAPVADAARADAAGTLVAYVRDARAGEIALWVGDREVLVSDRALAQRLLRAAG